MVNIFPFRGYRYSVELQKVITPPYDVIDKEMKAQFEQSSPYNFVHINLNDDHAQSNVILNKWIEEGILKQDEESLYIYEQEYVNEGSFTRTAFIGLLETEELGSGVLAHEQTFPKHIADRYDLMEHTKANLGQIFMIYEEQEKKIDALLESQKKNPSTFSEPGCTHRLYQITDENVIGEITSIMKDKILLIADGHHRYKTALQYANKHGQKKVMVGLVNAYNEGLIILPTNRVVKIDVDLSKLESHFNISEVEQADTPSEKNSFIIATTDKTYLLTLKEKQDKLDVSILHELIFELLDISEFEYIKGNKETLNRITQGYTAFFVKPPTLQETFAIAKSNMVMPQKSTYFYPKLYSGLVVHKW